MSTPAPAVAAAATARPRRRPTGIRLVLLVCAGLVVFGALGWLGHEVYRREQRKRWQSRAHAALSHGDFQNAGFWATRLVKSAPDRAENWRLLADIADAGGSPDAVLLRARIARMEPGNTDNLFAWAKSALRFRKFDMAADALKLVPETARDTVPYHSLVAAWALNTGQPALGEQHFADNVRLEPKEPLHALNLSAVRLFANDPAVSAAARARLETLAQTPAGALPARRALLSDALRRGDLPRAVALGHALKETLGAEFGDRLSALEAEERSSAPGAAESLKRLQEEAQEKAGNISSLVSWMIAHGRAREAVAWVQGAQTRGIAAAEETPARVALADALMSLKDWPALRAAVEKGDWGQVDFMRQATLARAVREVEPGAYPELWKTLTTRVQTQPENSLLLAQLAASWGWMPEAEAIWWQVAEKPSLPQRIALQNLFRLYSSAENTERLFAVARRQFEADRNDPAVRNNYAYLCLLLGNDLATAHTIAAELYAQNPKNPTVASTQALSLYWQKKSSDAVEVLAALSPDGLRDPTVALVNGLVLSATGQRDAARPYLDVAAGGKLLPEEKKLLNQAR